MHVNPRVGRWHCPAASWLKGGEVSRKPCGMERALMDRKDGGSCFVRGKLS